MYLFPKNIGFGLLTLANIRYWDVLGFGVLGTGMYWNLRTKFAGHHVSFSDRLAYLRGCSTALLRIKKYTFCGKIGSSYGIPS